MPGPAFAGELFTGFLEEAQEILAAANTGLMALDEAAREQRSSPRAVRELYRLMHTMKGLAAMIGVEPVVAIAHAMEAVLRSADHGEARLETEAVSVLLASVAAIGSRVRDLELGRTPRDAPAELIASLERLEAGTTRGSASVFLDGIPPEIAQKLGAPEREQLTGGLRLGQRMVTVELIPSAERAQRGITITSVRVAIAALADIVKVLPLSRPMGEDGPAGLRFLLVLLTKASDAELAAAVPDLEQGIVTLAATVPVSLPASVRSFEGAAAEEEDAAPATEIGARGRHVRVDVERLDDAMSRLSELIVNQLRRKAAVERLLAKGVDARELADLLQDDARALKGMRGAIVRLRMVPVAELLEPLALLLRGLRVSTGRAVGLRIEAGEAELDKAVAERVWPAIVHLVRNAADHGIEDAEARRLAGKPEGGTIRVTCGSFSSSRLEIRVADDGGGIDAERLARRAEASVPTDEAQLLALLCRAGLSTREQANTTSGRGMGMDIVKRIVVDELGGDLGVATAPGVGTTFILRVPLTVAIVDAFRVACAGHAYVVPVSSIDEVLTLDDLPRTRGPSTARRGGMGPVGLVRCRGETVALLDLGALLGHAGSERAKALVVRKHGVSTAFGVDGVLGQQEVVVRPLKDPLVQVAGVAGSADLGDGRPTLVLDLLALSARAGSSEGMLS